MTCSAVRALSVQTSAVVAFVRRGERIANAIRFAVRASTVTHIRFATSAGEQRQTHARHVFRGNATGAFKKKFFIN